MDIVDWRVIFEPPSISGSIYRLIMISSQVIQKRRSTAMADRPALLYCMGAAKVPPLAFKTLDALAPKFHSLDTCFVLRAGVDLSNDRVLVVGKRAQLVNHLLFAELP